MEIDVAVCLVVSVVVLAAGEVLRADFVVGEVFSLHGSAAGVASVPKMPAAVTAR